MKTLIFILSLLMVAQAEAKPIKRIGIQVPTQCFYQVPLDKFLSGNYTIEDLKEWQRQCLLRNSK